MEVRDPIHGAIRILDEEKGVIDHPLFQRLRNIKQLGFSELAFPSATHNRYSHSVGAMALAEEAFQHLFPPGSFSTDGAREGYRRCLRLATLLHDIGHPPLSHCTESAMPPVEELRLKAMSPPPGGRRSTHEDYTIKIVCESSLSERIGAVWPALAPEHVAALVEPAVQVEDGFFVDRGLDHRPILSQLVSGELDMDRLDYLMRDAHFAGVDYGRFDRRWLMTNLTSHIAEGDEVHLALDVRALYAFDDFLISRYHMFLSVYFHHRAVIYEEMLKRFFREPGTSWVVPVDMDAYATVDDHDLMARLRASESTWARRIVEMDAYSLLVEKHGAAEDVDLGAVGRILESSGIPIIRAESSGVLSKYAGGHGGEGPSIWVVDNSSILAEPPRPIQESTDLFEKYHQARQIARIYVPPERVGDARELLAG
jgi:HD superfamily phosphohydrolase